MSDVDKWTRRSQIAGIVAVVFAVAAVLVFVVLLVVSL